VGAAPESNYVARRPLVGMALFFVIGILLAADGWLSLWGAFAMEVLLLVGALVMRKRYWGRWALFLSISALGAIVYLMHPAVLGGADDDFEGVVEVIGAPQFYSYHSSELGCWVLSVRAGPEHQRRQFDLRLTGVSRASGISRGDQISCRGVIERSRFSGRPALWCMTLRDRSAWRVIRKGYPPIVDWVSEHFLQLGKRHLRRGDFRSRRARGIQEALLLGSRDQVFKEDYDYFRETGTLHIFAISGLHVGMVGFLLAILLRIGGVSRDRWGFWIFPLLLFYVMATGMKTSALRAVLMAGLYCLAPLLRRRPDVSSSIAFAAMLILIFRPLELFSAGFIFSFMVVGMIVMVYSALPAHWLRFERRRCAGFYRYVLSLVITSVAAFIGSTPLTALFFQRFTPVVLISNLVAVPLAFLIVLTGWVSILVGGLFPGIAAIYNVANDLFALMLIRAIEALSALPGAHGVVRSPPLVSLLLWYGGWVWFFTHATGKKERQLAMAAVLVAVALWLV
jgi:ComEC/Rec2-related protein